MRQFRLSAALLHALVLITAGSSVLADAVSWDRQAYGQKHYIPGHDNDESYAYFYPNNNNWSQELTFAYDNSNPPKPIYETGPSNWSTDTYPRSGDVTLGNGGLGANNAPTNLDRFVVSGETRGVLSLSSLTIQPDGGLNIEFGVTLTLGLLNLQGNNNADAMVTVSGGGGAWPVLNLTSGGTIKKTTGTSTFQLDQGIVLQAMNGGTIACDTGALQLPGNATTYVGPVNFNAATGALIDLAPAEAVDSGVVRFAGAFTGINTGGIVRLSKGWIRSLDGAGGVTLNFSGSTFQLQGGRLVGLAADPFTNIGTVNITGAATLNGVGGFINKGFIVQSGAGTLELYRGDLTNVAGAVYDIRNNLGITDYGPFLNSGTFRKSAGAGTSVLDPALSFDNIGGTIEVDSGTLALGSGLVSDGGPGDGGNFVVAAGATLELNDGTSNALYNGTYTGSGGGTVLLSGGGLNAVRFHAGTTFDLPPGMFQWTGGTIVTNSGAPFINTGAITITGAVGTYNYGGQFTNRGLVIQTGAGTIANQRGPVLNDAGGTYDIQNDLGYTTDYAGIINAGTFQKSAGTGTSAIAGEFDNSGTINAISGTLQFDALIQTAGAMNLNGGSISSQNTIILNGGLLAGSGNISGSVRNNSGIVSPGHSPGRINISGDYVQGADGALNIEIGGNAPGTGYDQLVVGGNADLGGTLNIKLVNGYRPQVGDVFTIISPSSFSGAFAQVNATGLGVQANYASGAITVTVTSVPEILLNIATRLNVQTGDNVLIAGFIITGTEPKKVIIRGLGPSLTGVSGVLANPTLELIDSDGTTLAFDDDWKDTQQSDIEASGIPPENDAEAAIVRTLDPGAYTGILRGKNNATGIGVVEVYDLAQTAKAKLANISSRGFASTGDDALIGGFIVGGGNGMNAKVVLRAIGPSLAPNVSNALADPTLELVDANGSTVRADDDWKDSQQSELETIGIQPTNDKESALIATLPAGSYTAVVRGKGSTAGVAVVEIYNVD